MCVEVKCAVLMRQLDAMHECYFPMRLPLVLGGAEEVIFDVCMSSPMYLG